MSSDNISGAALTRSQQDKPHLEPYKIILGYQVCFYAVIKGLYVVYDHHRSTYFAFHYNGTSNLDHVLEQNIRVHVCNKDIAI